MGWTNSGWRSDQGGWYKDASSAFTFAIWNNSDKGPTVTLSGSPLLVASFTNPTEIVRATKSASSGKGYFEYVATTQLSFTCCGFANSTHALSGTFLGSDTNGMSWIPSGGVFINNIAIATINSFAQGDVIGLAFDITAQKFWGRVNGGNWNNDVIGNQNPATGTGGVSTATMAAGPYFPTGFDNNGGGVIAANFGASAYNAAAPSGFGNW